MSIYSQFGRLATPTELARLRSQVGPSWLSQAATSRVLVKPLGGVRVTDLLGRLPGHLNADFAFVADSVVAELKCLEKDQINDKKVIKKASQLYAHELAAGKAPTIVFGDVRMNTAGFSDDARRIAELYRIPLERAVRRAANQIA
ncbi:hypothetical protein [Cupriavidus nantongensis]|uniref:hypothetical protein n=1 Tax=Cupriavidus nantongensis TaxID=1796606 RepID=UPI00358FF36B